LASDSLRGQVFLFANARRNRMTLLFWCGIPVEVVREWKPNGGIGDDSANFEA